MPSFLSVIDNWQTYRDSPRNDTDSETTGSSFLDVCKRRKAKTTPTGKLFNLHLLLWCIASSNPGCHGLSHNAQHENVHLLINLPETKATLPVADSLVRRLRLHYGLDGSADDSKFPKKSRTLPIFNNRSGSSIFRRPALQTFETCSSTNTNTTGSLRSPDRFLRRPTLDNSAQSFRVSKDPQSLTSDEKLLRSNEASPDAFDPRRRITCPIAKDGLLPMPRDFSANHTRAGGR
jgi:hypothetical protein